MGKSNFRNAIVISLALATASGETMGAVTTQTRTAGFVYDATTGLLIKEIVEPTTSALCVVTEHTYDSFGNKVAATTRNCNGSTGEVAAPTGDPVFAARSSTVTYDAQGRFPLSSKNALNHEEVRVYDQATGALLSLTGPNGLTTTWQYDGFGRKTLEVRSDGNRTAWSYRYCLGFNGGVDACPTIGGVAGTYLVQTTPQDSSGAQNGPQSTVYYDGLNREIRQESQGFDGGGSSMLIRVDTEYDSLGRVARKSRPYYAGQEIHWNNFGYDSLGRTISHTEPNGSTATIEYNGLTTVTTNSKGQKRTSLKNAQGQLVRVTDAADKTLDYTYDPNGNLIQTVDAAGNVIKNVFDLRGRKTQTVDPDLGTWNYVYNALGELIKQTDAKSQVTTMTYDKLGRMVQRGEPDLVSNWTYDSCTKGVGKLCQATSSNGYSRVNAYDSQGRANSSVVTIGANSYTTGATFDSSGRVATQTYPAGLVVRQEYTALGYLRAVRNNTTSALYWQADTFDAEGHLLLQTYGNSIQTQASYDPKTGRVAALVAGPGNNVQNFTFQYDSLGNLTARNDLNQNFTETFLYDNLNRLTSSTVNSSAAGVVTRSYSYDALGNITNRSEIGDYLYNASGPTSVRPHAVTRINMAGGYRTYAYDANGNVTTEVQYDAANQVVANRGRTQTYTSFNMPTRITGNNGYYADFAYGPEHQRVTQYSSKTNVDTTYLNPDNVGGLVYEKDVNRGNGQVEQRNYITVMGQVVALVKQDGTGAITSTRYLHRDHLGSLTTVTNESGAVVERLAYDPFGKRRYVAGQDDPNNLIEGQTSDRGYTNHEHLDELGLIHMNGRIYDPLIGRFLSADPIIQDPENLQNYNRYGYCFNNPLICTDPSGYGFLSKLWKKIKKPFIRIAAAVLDGMGCSGFCSAAVGAYEGYKAGGWAGAFRGGLTAYFSYQAFTSIGQAANAGNWSDFARVAAHAAVGCASSVAGGGDCKSGAISAGLSKFATLNAPDWVRYPDSMLEVAGGVVYSAVIGGTASELSGGKFANGAITAAMGYLFNQVRTVRNARQWQLTIRGEMLETQIVRAEHVLRQLDPYFSTISAPGSPPTQTYYNYLLTRIDQLIPVARANAVEQAWRNEVEAVRAGTSTYNWTFSQARELLSSGRVAGYQGHHQYSVSRYPEFAGRPEYIRFYNRTDHLNIGHGGNWRNASHGP